MANRFSLSRNESALAAPAVVAAGLGVTDAAAAEPVAVGCAVGSVDAFAFEAGVAVGAGAPAGVGVR